ncbi:pseudouridine synthase [Schizosaccharomyces japonicus yFS275]|uniref:Pseudouridine synthase n=1 Tax=Schizosaccharomyces japonicus (strain yFS275 / FY16936) TaxID=402676 RepID=B6K4K9_SCHJY|nr:pseudouridine synthase [Schizosaccharomyces japonicus yFS275]EEB08416.1 pseudouridine synthase [Schizosaccharomyces japonicus yFS275]
MEHDSPVVDGNNDRVKRLRVDEESGSSSAVTSPASEVTSASEISKSVVDENAFLTEKDVGIEAYIHPETPAIDGIIKARFTDFSVFEIAPDGTVIHLTDMAPCDPAVEEDKKSSVPTTKTQETHSESSQTEKNANVKDTVQDVPLSAFPGVVLAILGEEPTVTFLKQLKSLSTGETKDAVVLPVPEGKALDKEQRTLIHQFIRQHFGTLESTVDKEGVFRVKPVFRKRNSRQNRDPRMSWKALGGEYCHFHLYKENRDTMDCLGRIARLLKIPTRQLLIAGTKDRRGITCQRVAIRRIRSTRLVQLNQGAIANPTYGFRLGNFSYKQRGLALGDLQGNEFHLILRNVQTPEDQINESLTKVKADGFINYFGLQRFGTSSVGTHEVGIELLRSNWKAAIELILSQRPEHSGSAKEAMEIWHSKHDPAAALAKLPRRFVAESSILETFSREGNTTNYLGAFQRIPRHLRSIYAHAYQSYVWNRVVSWRIQQYGLQVREGDLVLVSQSEVGSSSKLVDPEAKDLVEDVIVSDKPVAKIVTKEDLEKYTIYDVVLPLPGRSVIYPKNETFDTYKRIMAEHELDPENMARKDRELSLPGDYRRLVVKANKLEWSILKYDDAEQQLLPTDRDILEGNTIPDSKTKTLTALALNFQLPSSSYATMVLREATKMATSSGDQRQKMNNSTQK